MARPLRRLFLTSKPTDTKFRSLDHMSMPRNFNYDITKRVRTYADIAYSMGSYVEANTMMEAVDEIERLREIILGQDIFIENMIGDKK